MGGRTLDSPAWFQLGEPGTVADVATGSAVTGSAGESARRSTPCRDRLAAGIATEKGEPSSTGGAASWKNASTPVRRVYSGRIAVAGSIVGARRAGSHQAIAATPSKSTVTTVSVAGSV